MNEIETAVAEYVQLIETGTPPLSAALTTQAITDVPISALHDELVRQGLL